MQSGEKYVKIILSCEFGRKNYGMSVRMNTKPYRINLHMHTTDSDGRKSPEEAIAIYKAAGYDAVAITDHWVHGEEREINGMKVFSGCEYNFGGNDSSNGVYHILSLFCTHDPGVVKGEDDPMSCVRKIHAAGGLAVLAHPAWSLNQPDLVEQIEKLEGFDATEVFNTVSGEKNSNRPYSGAFVDQMASRGICFSLFSSDDVHYYEFDATCGAIIVELPELTREALIDAIRSEQFYAVSGGSGAPTLSVTETENGIDVSCSPAAQVNIFTNSAFAVGRHIVGEGITEYHYEYQKFDRVARVEVTDSEGRTAYSNFVRVQRKEGTV